MSNPINRREFVSLAAATGAALSIGNFASARQPAAAGQEAGTPRPGAAVAKPDAKASLASAVAFLKTKQDKASGAWGASEKGPTFPAITGLVVTGLLTDPATAENDAAVEAGIKYILQNQQPDGGIYNKILPSYNTSICLTALAGVKKPSAAIKEAMAKARAYLRTIQYGEEAVVRDGVPDSAQKVAKDHAFYGGVGYGNHGRPDLSNTSFFVEALHASGVDANDPALVRALVFLQRTQMLEKMTGPLPPKGEIMVNDMPYAKGSHQGGFIYATSEDKDNVATGSSAAGTMKETLSDGTISSRLRAYGSMTYSGFKSYLYAGLKKDDQRVVAARAWISRNYTLEENPGVGTDGLYYYFVVFAKAMAAYGEPRITAISADGKSEVRVWRDDIAARLATLQQADGSFKTVDDRWMENNPVLIAAYAMNALALAVVS